MCSNKDNDHPFVSSVSCASSAVEQTLLLVVTGRPQGQTAGAPKARSQAPLRPDHRCPKARPWGDPKARARGQVVWPRGGRGEA